MARSISFNETLLKTYIPASTQDCVTNISYHTLETFPDRPFGYLELPVMEAQKIKKKYNGTILKGAKVKISDAIPERKRRSDDDGQVEAEPVKIQKKKVEKEKGEIVGAVLEEGRNVKRGWTEPPDPDEPPKKKSKENKEGKNSKKKDKDGKKKREPSKYTNDTECLFRLEKIPPNVLSAKDEKKKKKFSKALKNGEVIVHEFENTQKHATFLRSGKLRADTKMASEYVYGKGWVDNEGNIVEAETDTQRVKRERRDERKKAKQVTKEAKHAVKKAKEQEKQAALTHNEEQQKKAKAEEKARNAAEDAAAELEHEDDDTDIMSPEPPPIDSKKKKTQKTTVEPVTVPASEERFTTAPPTATEVHPLEALFKRAKPSTETTPIAPIKTSFSFFDASEDIDDEEDANAAAETTENLPQTPFTERDLQWRREREGAPTPDTAAINRKFSWSVGRIVERDAQDHDEEDEEQETGRYDDVDMGNADALGITNGTVASMQVGGDGDEKEESEFAKWFWENRGDTNRAWKKRRRDAMKIKRKRENRRLTRRVV